MAFAPPPLESYVEEESPVSSRVSAIFNPPPPESLVEDEREARQQRLMAEQVSARQERIPTSLALLARADTAARKTGLNFRRMSDAVSEVTLAPAVAMVSPEAGAKYFDAIRENLRYYNERDRQLSGENAALDDNSIASQLVEGTTRAALELPVQLFPGAMARNAANAVRASAATAAAMQGASTLGQERGEGRSMVEALPYAATSAAITGLTTKAFGATGVEGVFRSGGVSGVWNRIVAALKDAGLEATEEMADQFQQDLLERYARNPNKPITNTVKDVLMAGSIGGIVGGLASGVKHGVEASRSRRTIEAMRPPVDQQANVVPPDAVGRINAGLDSMRPEFDAATDRVTAAITERKNIKGEDARLAGARDRLPEMGYAYNEAQDVFIPVRQVERGTVEQSPTVATPPAAVTPPINPGGSQAALPPAQQAVSQQNNSLKAFADANGVEYVAGDTGATILAKVNAKKASAEIPKGPSEPVAKATVVKPTVVEQTLPAAPGRRVAVVSTGKPNGAKAEVEYDVVEAASLKPMIVRDVNADQTRQRGGNAASDEQIAKIATAPDIALLSESPTSTVGAPIVDDVVIAGNGRVAGLIAGYEGTTRGAQDYRRGVVAEASRLGIGDVSGMVNPVLIRRVKRYTSGDKAAFVVESNPKYAALKESTSEAALLDAQALGDIGALPFNESGSLTAAGVQQVAQLFDKSQRNLTRTVGGDFDSREANNRVQLAALALLARENNVPVNDFIGLIESDDGRRVMGEVTRVAPKLTKLDADLRIGGRVLASMKELQRGIAAVRDGAYNSLDEWNAERQNELLQSSLDPTSEALLGKMIESQKKGAILRDIFNEYLTLAEYEQNQRNEAGQTADIFGEKREAATAETVLNKVLQPGANGRQVVAPSNQQREPEVKPEPPAAPAAKRYVYKSPLRPVMSISQSLRGTDWELIDANTFSVSKPLDFQLETNLELEPQDPKHPKNLKKKRDAFAERMRDELDPYGSEVELNDGSKRIASENVDPKYKDEFPFRVTRIDKSGEPSGHETFRDFDEVISYFYGFEGDIKSIANAKPVAPAATPATPAPVVETSPVVKESLTTEPELKKEAGNFNTGSKVRVGNNPQPHSILRETTDPKFPDERIFEVQNDRTEEKFETDANSLTPITERSAEERAASKGKTIAQINQELRDLSLDPKAYPNKDAKLDAIKRERAKSPKPTLKQKAAALAEKLDALKAADPRKGGTNAFGIIPDTWNVAISIAQAIIRAGGTVADAIAAAIRHIQDNHTGYWDEAAATAALEAQLSEPPVTPETAETSEDGEGRQGNVFGAPEIGEAKPVENIASIKAALIEAGYAVGDTVTPENTARAREIFASFIDPNTRAETLNQLRASVPEQMAPALVESGLWTYAVRMAAAGDASLMRAMVENHNQFAQGGGSEVVTIGNAARIMRGALDGASFPVWKNAVEIARERVRAVANELGVEQDLLNQIIVELNRATPDVTAVVTETAQTLMPDGRTVQQTLDTATATQQQQGVLPGFIEAETRRNVNRNQRNADTIAAEILRRLELDYAGVEWRRPENRTLRAQIQRVLRDFYRSDAPILENPLPTIQGLAEQFVALGVSQENAMLLARAAETKRQTDFANARSRAMQRASQSNNLRSLIDSILETPYLAQSSPEWLRETAMNWFMASGLSREQAVAAADIFNTQFRQKLAEASEKIAQRMLQGSPPNSVQAFVKALRAGMLDPSRPWADVFATKAGWKPATAEQNRRLAEIEMKMQNPELTTPEIAKLTEEMMGIYLHMKLPPGILTSIAANAVATNLTGFRTFTVNVFAPIFQSVFEKTLNTITNPRQLFNIWKPFAEAWSNSLREFKFAFTNDAFTFTQAEMAPATNELRRIWETSMDVLKDPKASKVKKSVALGKSIFGLQQFAMRTLNAVDQASLVAVREQQMALYGHAAFKQAGLGTAEINALTEATATMKRIAVEDALAKGLSKDDARVHADAIVHEQMQNFIANKVGDSAANQARKAAEMDAYSAVGRLAPNIKDSDEGGLMSRIIGNWLLKASNELRKSSGIGPMIGVALFGYLNIPYRTARYFAWNSPYGLLRLGIHQFRKSRGWENQWKQTLATEYQERQRLKMALASTAALAAVGALAAAFLKSSSGDEADDEWGWFITGAGPKNKELRDYWKKLGFVENSIILRFKLPGLGQQMVAVPLTRIGEPLAHVMFPESAYDDFLWRKREAEASGREFKETPLQTAGYAAGTYMGMAGQRGVIQNISRWTRIASGEGGTTKAVADAGGSLLASAITPFLGLQRSLAAMFDGQVERSSIQSVLIASEPVLGAFMGKEAVNRFGDKLGNRSWQAQIGATGLPISFNVEDARGNREMYVALANKGVAPPQLRRYVLEEKYGPLTDAEYSDFAAKSGALLKQSVSKNVAALEKMTPENAKKFIANAAQGADNTAAAALDLKPVPKAATAPKSVPVSSAPAARSTSSSPARQSTLSVPRSRPPSGRIRSGRSSLASFKSPRLKKPSGRIRSRGARGFAKLRVKSGRIRSSFSRARRPRIRKYVA